MSSKMSIYSESTRCESETAALAGVDLRLLDLPGTFRGRGGRSYGTRPTVQSDIIHTHLTVLKYEFLVQNSDPGGAISGQSVLRAFRDVRPGGSMGTVGILCSFT